MPPKKPAKGAGAGPDEAEVKGKLKGMKDVLDKFLVDCPGPEANLFVAKMVDSQGWSRPGGPEHPAATYSLVLSGEIREEGQDFPSTIALKNLGKALKQMVPLYVNLKSLCLWKTALTDEGLKSFADFSEKVRANWEGLVNLELVESRITAAGCEALAERLARNVPLRTLVLDFNGGVGDAGAAALSAGLKSNTNLVVLSLAFCGLTSVGCVPLAEGVVRLSRTRTLNLQGNRLGIHVASGGVHVQGSGIVPLFSAAVSARLWEEPPNRDKNEPDQLETILKEGFKAKAVEGSPGVHRAMTSEWAGYDLQVVLDEPLVEGGIPIRSLYARNETLTSLNVSDNCIMQDIEKSALTLCLGINHEVSLVPINETAIVAGKARIHESAYCTMGKEIVEVVSVLPEGHVLLARDVEVGATTIQLAARINCNGTLVSVPEIKIEAGEVLLVDKEMMHVRAVRGETYHVTRGESVSDAAKHQFGTKVYKFCSVNVKRGAAFTQASEHCEGLPLDRLSVIEHMCAMLKKNKSIQDINFEHNDIGHGAAVLLVEPVARLNMFTLSGKEISEEVFKVLYKDGTTKKKGGKKKKK